MNNLKPHEQDTLRHLLNAFAAAPANVQLAAIRTLNAQRIDAPLRLVQGQRT